MQSILDFLRGSWGNLLFSGIVASWMVALFFHWRAGRQLSHIQRDLSARTDNLRTQAENLATLNGHIMNALEHAGLVEWRRRDDGTVQGRVIRLSASDRLNFSDGANTG